MWTMRRWNGAAIALLLTSLVGCSNPPSGSQDAGDADVAIDVVQNDTTDVSQMDAHDAGIDALEPDVQDAGMDASDLDVMDGMLEESVLDAGVDSGTPDVLDVSTIDVQDEGIDAGTADTSTDVQDVSADVQDTSSADAGIDTGTVDAGLPLCVFDNAATSFDNCRFQ